MSGTLSIVATPIGNLGDLTVRAAEVLCTADLVLAEDTRRTGRLLAHVGSTAPQRSLHEHNERARTDELVARLLEGATVALVTDAGTPLISDPGLALVRGCIEAGVPVVPVPGASAVLAALVVSGIASDRMAFDGFLPRRGRARTQRLAELAREPRTTVLFLAPHRAAEDLADLARACGEDRPAALCRELTKLHEDVRRGTLAELHAGVEDGVRGELTLVIAGAEPDEPPTLEDTDAVAEVAARVAEGASTRDAVAEVAAELGLRRRDLYAAVTGTDGAPSTPDAPGATGSPGGRQDGR
jgi:16S rRNA (cytidine1402-2'-O)-methyltransferase